MGGGKGIMAQAHPPSGGAPHEDHAALTKSTGTSAKHGGKGEGSQIKQLLTIGNLMKIPATLAAIRTFADAVNWNAAESEIRQELRQRVVIVGLPNAGKSTLFNRLRGRYQSAVSSEPGTTRSLIAGTFGPFTMIDTPGHLPETQEAAARDAAVIVLLLDGTRPLNQADRALYDRIAALKRPIIVAVNKIDAVGGDAEGLAARYAAQLGVSEAIPISARDGTNITEDLIPTLIEISPEAALAIGHDLPTFRRVAAERIVRNAALVGLAAGLEPIPMVDIPILIGNQMRMVLRIAALYGEPVGSQYLRELFATVAGGLALRYVAGELAKAVPLGGDLVSGAIAAAGTWAIGMVAVEYFEEGKQISPNQLRLLFKGFYSGFRARQRQDANSGLVAGTD